MRKTHLLSAVLLSGVLLLTGCAGPKASYEYSNLTESTIRYDLDSLLQSAGVGEQQRFVLFQHVDQINELLSPAQLTDGFTDIHTRKYDPYALQEAWDAKYPDFMGYNCRITAFSLFAPEHLSFPEQVKEESTDLLEFDMAALAEDDSAFLGMEDRFTAFFAAVPTEDTKDVEIHGKNVLEAWKSRGISFRDDPAIRMINMVFHAQDGEINQLFVGHSGILLPTPDGDLWFLEKLAFQEPYQVVKFQNRKELQSYLMEKYDLDQGQPMAKPFILENDAMMKI